MRDCETFKIVTLRDCVRVVSYFLLVVSYFTSRVFLLVFGVWDYFHWTRIEISSNSVLLVRPELSYGPNSTQKSYFEASNRGPGPSRARVQARAQAGPRPKPGPRPMPGPGPKPGPGRKPGPVPKLGPSRA